MIQFSPVTFRVLFPEFGNIADYSDNTLSLNFTTASVYISNRTGNCYCGGMTIPQRTQALNLMTAHLLALSNMIAQGNTPGVVTGATIDKVNVTLMPPPVKNQFQYWLSQTSYGQQLLALLQVASVGGFYVSSAVPGRAGFQFGNGW